LKSASCEERSDLITQVL